MYTGSLKIVRILLAGLLLGAVCGCDLQPAPSPTPVPPTPTLVPPAGNSGGKAEAISLLDKAEQAMHSVKSFHFIMEISGTDGSVSRSEGDLSVPDKNMRVKNGSASAMQNEMLIFDGGKEVYYKSPGDSGYSASSASDIMEGVTAVLVDPLKAFNPYDASQDAKVAGEEKLDGVDTTKVTYSFHFEAPNPGAPAPMPEATLAPGQAAGSPPTPTPILAQPTTGAPGASESSVSFEVWVEKGTNYVRRFRMTSRIPPAAAGSGVGGAAGNPPNAQTTTLTYSDFNKAIDPPIERPKTLMPTPTGVVNTQFAYPPGGGIPTDTPAPMPVSTAGP
ncbi:MAG: LppX_LprAFG lipoprotein [Chloroflexia bacterium]